MIKLRVNKATKVVFLILLVGLEAACQSNDAGLWLSVNARKSITQAFSVNYTHEVRIMENISEAATIFGDLGVDYNLNKHFKLSANYRHKYQRRPDDSYANYNRYYFDLSYKQKFKPLVFSIRQRIQSEFSGYNTGRELNPELYSRTKLTLKADLDRKFSPYFSTELFLPINEYSNTYIDKVRYSAGIDYEFTPRHALDISYMVQDKIGSLGENDFIIGLGYSFSF